MISIWFFYTILPLVMMLKKVVKIIDFLLGAVMAILGSTLLMLVVLLLVKLFMGDVYGL